LSDFALESEAMDTCLQKMKRENQKRIFTLVVGFTALAAIFAGTSACSSRMRTADFNVDQSQVVSQLNAFQSQITNCQSGSVSAQSQAFDTSFFTMMNDPSTSLYYAAAPDMGPLSVVAPVNFRYLTQTPPGPVGQFYAYFLIRVDQDGPHGALLLTGQDGSGTGAANCSGNGSGISAATTTPGSNNLMDFGFIGLNDGTAASLQSASGTVVPLQPGDISSDDGFVMDVNINGNVIRIRSDDIADDGTDLADVVQLQLYLVDPQTGDEGYIGQINMMQPN
jgi:hypothetical protein